jgi:putative ABC transport system ATP-binding protein
MASEPLLELSNITKQYDSDGVVTPVLHGVSFSMQPGDFVSLMGPSGCGKSTLLHIIGLLDRPSSGTYRLAGREVGTLEDDEELARLRGTQIGFVFQSFNLLPRTTVLDNVAMPLLYTGASKTERLARARAAAASVGLAHREQYLSSQLSGGEKQRVAIARALVNDPALIVADEPTGNLDSKSGVQVMEILQDLNDAGRTVLLVTHERQTAECAKRIIRLRDGNIVSDEKLANPRRASELADLK